MQLIPLGKGQFAQVDDTDFDWLNQWQWHAVGGRYAARRVRVDGKSRYIRMHRLILGLTDPAEFCDHRDRDKLNNCRSNLRRCTKAQNAMNSRRLDEKTSRFKGVFKPNFFRRRPKPWVAKIHVGDRDVFLGYHATEEGAAHAYDSAARELFGEFALLNFPVSKVA